METIKADTLREIDNARRGALTAYKLLGLFENGGHWSDVADHLYITEDMARIVQQETDAERLSKAEADELNLLMALQTHARTRGVGISDIRRDSIGD